MRGNNDEAILMRGTNAEAVLMRVTMLSQF